jgi:hypothetical protein
MNPKAQEARSMALTDVAVAKVDGKSLSSKIALTDATAKPGELSAGIQLECQVSEGGRIDIEVLPDSGVCTTHVSKPGETYTFPLSIRGVGEEVAVRYHGAGVMTVKKSEVSIAGREPPPEIVPELPPEPPPG